MTKRSTVERQGHFTAPAKRFRAEHRRPDAERRPHGQFRPQRRKSRPPESSWPPRWRSPLGKVVHMEAEFTIEPTGRRVVLAKLRSVLRGDKCMADASLLDAPGRAVPGASTTRAGLGH